MRGCAPSSDMPSTGSAARDLETTVSGVREVHHMHVWSLDGTSNMATLHACSRRGVDAHQAVSAIKKRLASEHAISHATVEPEYGACADDGDDHDHDHAHDAAAHHDHHH